jgi:cell division protein FtsN
VASYRSREKADALAAQLRDSGFQMGVEKALVDGRTYYRVLTRRVDSRQQADTLQKRLRDEGFEELLLKRKRM